MGKLFNASFVSLDGVVSNPWDWIGSFYDEKLQSEAIEKLKNVDLFFLDRKTIDRFASTWQT